MCNFSFTFTYKCASWRLFVMFKKKSVACMLTKNAKNIKQQVQLKHMSFVTCRFFVLVSKGCSMHPDKKCKKRKAENQAKKHEFLHVNNAPHLLIFVFSLALMF